MYVIRTLPLLGDGIGAIQEISLNESRQPLGRSFMLFAGLGILCQHLDYGPHIGWKGPYLQTKEPESGRVLGPPFIADAHLSNDIR